MKKRNILYTVLALQLAVLVGFYFMAARGISNPTYLLRAHRVDPRDLLRGDYMILDYDDLKPYTNNKDASIAYVSLRRNGKYWVSEEVLFYKPQSLNQPFLKAQTRDGHFDYGIERYYVPEGKGTPIGTEFSVEVSIHPETGQAQIKQLFVDGKPWP